MLIRTQRSLSAIRADIEVYRGRALLPLSDLRLVNLKGLRLIPIVAAAGSIWWQLHLSDAARTLLRAQSQMLRISLSAATPASDVSYIEPSQFPHL